MSDWLNNFLSPEIIILMVVLLTAILNFSTSIINLITTIIKNWFSSNKRLPDGSENKKEINNSLYIIFFEPSDELINKSKIHDNVCSNYSSEHHEDLKLEACKLVNNQYRFIKLTKIDDIKLSNFEIEGKNLIIHFIGFPSTDEGLWFDKDTSYNAEHLVSLLTCYSNVKAVLINSNLPKKYIENISEKIPKIPVIGFYKAPSTMDDENAIATYSYSKRFYEKFRIPSPLLTKTEHCLVIPHRFAFKHILNSLEHNGVTASLFLKGIDLTYDNNILLQISSNKIRVGSDSISNNFKQELRKLFGDSVPISEIKSDLDKQKICLNIQIIGSGSASKAKRHLLDKLYEEKIRECVPTIRLCKMHQKGEPVKVFSGKDTDTEQKYPMEMFEEQQKTFDNLISLIEDKVEGILCNGISPSFSQSFKQQNPIQKESEKQFQKVLVENNLKEKLTKQTQYIKPNNPNVITNNNKPKIFLQVIGHEK